LAPARPYWKGYLKLSLVSCPVAIYSASSSSERIAFRQINKQTGNRVKQQLVDEETREPIEPGDKGRGYEVSKGVFVMVEDEEIDAVAIESSHTIDIDSFVPRAQIDKRYLDSPYYIIPDDKVGAEAFAVIRDAMRGKDMVALGRVVFSKRERVMMLEALDNGLMGTTLRYPYELRAATVYFEDIPDVKIPKEMLSLAEHILESKKADFEPDQFVDRYEEALVDMIRKKQAGMPAPQTKTASRPAVIVNLFDALRQSMEEEKKKTIGAAPKAGAVAKGKKPPKKPIPGQRELLLPISGKKAVEEPVKKPAEVKSAKPASPRRKAG